MSTDNSSALDSKAKVRDPEACVSVEKEQSSNVSVEDTKEQTKKGGISVGRALLESL